MARWTDDELHRRAAEADNARAPVQGLIDECLYRAMPWRRRGGRRPSFDHIFDSTALTSVQRFGARLQRDLCPPFQHWFKLESGPMVPAPQRDALDRDLEAVSDIVHAVLDASSFGSASQEGFSDLSIGTMALLATEGDDREPIRFQAAPPWMLGVEEGAFGRIDNVFFRKPYPAWALPRHWPAATWPEAIRKKIADRETGLIEVLQATYYDEDTQGWRLAIQVREGDARSTVFDSEHRTNPWIIPRWWTTPGLAWGVGPLMAALPDIRTGDKTVEMILQAAAYQLAPPLTVLHDGVVNPDTLRMAPRALIRVARTGGPMGASIQPLNIGANVDLAQIVLEDNRAGIKRGLLDEQLPPSTGAVRSASEIVERAKALQYDAGAAFGRMNHEFVPQVIARVIDILDKKKVALIDWNKLQVDHLTLRVNVISPLARSQSLDDAQNTVQWAETLKAIGGDEMVVHSANVEDLGSYLGGKMGVAKSLVRTKAERTALEQAAGAAAAQAQGAQAQGAQPPAQPELSGGAQPAKFATAPATLAIPAGA